MEVRPRQRAGALARELETTRGALDRASVLRVFGERALKEGIREGSVARLLPGTYVASTLTSAPDVRVRAAARWSAPLGAATGVAGAWLWGIVRQPPHAVSIQLPPTVHRGAPAWLRVVRPDVPIRVFSVDGARTCAPADVVVQAWNETCGDVAIGLVVAAVGKRIVAVSRIAEAIERTPRVRRREELRGLLALLDGGVTSFLEHRARTRVFPHSRFPELNWQVPVHAAGKKRLLDAFAADARLALEFDGTEFHDKEQDRLDDIARDAELATIGIQTLRFSYDALMNRPAWCREIYRAARTARLQSLRPGAS